LAESGFVPAGPLRAAGWNASIDGLALLYAETMPIDARQVGSGVAVVTVSGRLVLGAEVERLDTVLSELLTKEQKRIVFDLSAMDYADSSGIGTLVSCITKVRKAGGELRVAGVNPRIQRIFKMTGVDTLMSMYPTLAEATVW
jgi:anti-sigma B factor antagonist